MNQIDDRILSLVKDGLAFPEQFNIAPKTIKELVCDFVYDRFIPAGPLTVPYNFQEEMLNPKQVYHRMYEYGNSTRWYNNLIGKCLRRMGSRMRKNTASYWLIDLWQPANIEIAKANIEFINNYKAVYKGNHHKTPKRDQLSAS